jgi:hypothetical protein
VFTVCTDATESDRDSLWRFCLMGDTGAGDTSRPVVTSAGDCARGTDEADDADDADDAMDADSGEAFRGFFSRCRDMVCTDVTESVGDMSLRFRGACACAETGATTWVGAGVTRCCDLGGV